MAEMNDAMDFSPEALEAQIAEMEQVDEFSDSINYDKFVVLPKKELSNFARLVEPLVKQSVDNYGKSVYFRCISDDEIELNYINAPFFLRTVVPNKSGKQIKSFAIPVSTLKKLVCQAFASIILVEENNDINIALCESLLYLETVNLEGGMYKVAEQEATTDIDSEGAAYVFKKLGASLVLTERASEKNIVIKNGTANFNTGVFAASATSPFKGEESFVVFKQTADLIALVTEFSKGGVKYALKGDKIILKSDAYYVEAGIGVDDMVQKFSSPAAEMALKFDAKVQIVNDNLLRIVTIVKSLEYFSDIVTITFSKEQLTLTIASTNQSKKSQYAFNIVEGTPTVTGDMKITLDTLKLFLSIVGSDCKYDFTETGLCIETPNGKFIVRKNG